MSTQSLQSIDNPVREPNTSDDATTMAIDPRHIHMDDNETSEEIVHRPFQKHGDPFIKNNAKLLETLQCLHANEEAFMFRNRADDMTIMIRSMADATDQMMAFELLVVFDPAEDKHSSMRRLLEMEYSCVKDDEDDYIFETIAVGKDVQPGEIDEVVDSMNFMYDMKICECFDHLMKTDDIDVCFMCNMTSGDEKNTGESCIICTDVIHTTRGLRRMSCCTQTMHVKCYEKWKSTEDEKICPVCRK